MCVPCVSNTYEMHRVNITIEEKLHAQAKAHAREVHHATFSGLVVKLVLADMAQGRSGIQKRGMPMRTEPPTNEVKRRAS